MKTLQPLATTAPVNMIGEVKDSRNMIMKHFRVSIKYYTGAQMATISATVPAYNDTHAINLIIEANGLEGKVVANSAQLLTT